MIKAPLWPKDNSRIGVTELRDYLMLQIHALSSSHVVCFIARDPSQLPLDAAVRYGVRYYDCLPGCCSGRGGAKGARGGTMIRKWSVP